MVEKVLIGFIGAFLALTMREIVEHFRTKNNMKKLSAICIQHLEQIKSDLNHHVSVVGGKATFDETQYCEVVVGDFLYDLVTSNIHLFPDAKTIERTIIFFHHYKVNMTTIQARLSKNKDGPSFLTEGTYNNLRRSLDDALDELNGIAGN